MKKLFAIALFAVLMGTSCKKETTEFTPATNTQKATNTAEIKVSDNFNWKTTQEISLDLIGYANAPVMIVDLKGNVLEKALLSTNTKYSTIISLPTTEKKVKLLYMGQEVILDLNQTNITYQFN